MTYIITCISKQAVLMESPFCGGDTVSEVRIASIANAECFPALACDEVLLLLLNFPRGTKLQNPHPTVLGPRLHHLPSSSIPLTLSPRRYGYGWKWRAGAFLEDFHPVSPSLDGCGTIVAME
jgi:hypothetical protein